MSEFTQNTVSSFPSQNILFNSAAGITAQGLQTNQLLNQQRQQELNTADMEHVSRLSAALLNITDPAERAQAYARGVGVLQSYGKAMRAPPTMPDEQTLRMLAAQGVSSEKQYEYGAGRTAAQGALGALGVGNTGTGGAPGGVATTPSATIEPAAFNNATAVRDGLIKRGMDPDTATGAAANALHESVANPRTGRGDNGNAAGIFMWTGPRLQAYIDKTGHPPDGAPLDEQLDFLMSEWNGSESAAAAKIAAAQGPAAKAAAFSQYFLRPKDTTGEMQRRSATALQLQQQIGGGGTTAAATPAGGGGASGRVQVASITPTTATDGTTAPPGSTAAPDARWDLPGAPAPDQPPAPATAPAAATPAPAPQVPLAPMLQLRPSGLTAEQEALFTDQANRPQSLAQAQALAARVEAQIAHNQSYNAQAEEHNVARQRQAASDALAQQKEAREAANQAAVRKEAAEAAARDATRVKLLEDAAQAARLKEDREAVEANKPFHGNTPDAQNRNILIEGTNGGKTDTTEYASAYADYGTEKVDANGLRYRPDMSPYATPTGKTYGEGKGGRDLGKADVGQGPLPPPVIYTAMQGNLAGLRNVDRALKELETHPASVGVTGLQPDWLSQRTDPEGIKLRADISDILSQTFHERSGAAVMVSEAQRMKPFTPTQTDTAVALRTKLERIRQNYLDTLSDHYSTYGPESGGRAIPRVEAALKENVPKAPPDLSKKPPGFDKKVQ